jgi:hypothetical protein
MQASKNSPAILQDSFRLLEKMLADRNMGEPQPVQRSILRLPLLNNSTITMTSSWELLPPKISMARASEEEVAVTCMIDEITDRLAVDLDPTPVINRWPSVVEAQLGGGTARSALVVGSSPACKLAAALWRAATTPMLFA